MKDLMGVYVLLALNVQGITAATQLITALSSIIGLFLGFLLLYKNRVTVKEIVELVKAIMKK